MRRIAATSAEHDHEVCPFCAQDLRASPVIDHYRAYFSEGYASLKGTIADQIARIKAAHGGDVPAAFERAVRVLIQRREFWQRFTEVPDIAIDTAAVARAWKAAREAVLAALHAKQGAPLDATALPATALAAIASYDESRDGVMTISGALQVINAQIAIVKEQAAAANVATLAADLAKLKAARPAIAPWSRRSAKPILTRRRSRLAPRDCAIKPAMPLTDTGGQSFRPMKPRSMLIW
jgi:wobble nucleotide-excising tRNase